MIQKYTVFIVSFVAGDGSGDRDDQMEREVVWHQIAEEAIQLIK